MRRTENKRTIGGWHDCDVVTCDQNQGVTPCQESWHDNGPGLYNFETHDSFNKGIFAKNYASWPTKRSTLKQAAHHKLYNLRYHF